jgi:hypothetical protein
MVLMVLLVAALVVLVAVGVAVAILGLAAQEFFTFFTRR